MTAYDIFHKRSSTSDQLTMLLMCIKIFNIQLCCFVSVLHVPDTAMISKDTNGLSRGVLYQCLQYYAGHELLSNLCHAGPLIPTLLIWAHHVFHND